MQKGSASPHNRRSYTRNVRSEMKPLSPQTGMTDHERLLQVFGNASPKRQTPTADSIVDGIEGTAATIIQKARRGYLARRSLASNAKSIVVVQRWYRRIKRTKGAQSVDEQASPHGISPLPLMKDSAPPEGCLTTCPTIDEKDREGQKQEDTFSKNSNPDVVELAKNDIKSASQTPDSDVSLPIRPNDIFLTQPQPIKEGSCSSRQGKSNRIQGNPTAAASQQADPASNENNKNMPPQEQPDLTASFTINERELVVSSPTIITEKEVEVSLLDTLSTEGDKACDLSKETSRSHSGTPTFDFCGEEKKEEKEPSPSVDPRGSPTQQVQKRSSTSEAPIMSAEAEVISLEARESTSVVDSSKEVANHDNKATGSVETAAETDEESTGSKEEVTTVTPGPKETETPMQQESVASSTPEKIEVPSPCAKSTPTTETAEKKSPSPTPEQITAQTAKAVALKLAARRKSKSSQKPPKPSPPKDLSSSDEEDSLSVQEEAILAFTTKKSPSFKYGAASPNPRLSNIMKKFESPLPNAPKLDTPPTTIYRATPPQRNRVRNFPIEASPLTPATPGAPMAPITPSCMHGNPATPATSSISKEQLEMEMAAVELRQEKLKSLEEKIALETKLMELNLENKRLKVRAEEADFYLQVSEKKRMESDEAYIKLGAKIKKMDSDAQSVAQQTHASMVTNGQQQALMQESGKMLEYLRKEVLKLRKENSGLKSDVANLEDNAKRLVEANDAAEGNFATLTNHAKNEIKKLEFAAEEAKQQIKELKMSQAEQKDEIRMKQAAYVNEVHSRLQYQEAMSKIVDLLQRKCRDSRLVEQVLQITDDVEDSDERMQSPSAKDDYAEEEEPEDDLLDSSMVGRFTSFFA